ncbi:uncharacterized protein LOC143219714 [Lasioglossum baleicum]|uniref:uncharacterized protein LOC143219714 n=1 Tax=Lasioglossum baleicum TaxID=434251 RepID=UPI003FCEC408
MNAIRQRLNPKTSAPLMGELPSSRVKQSRPFENVGIDYCGPFFIKEKKNRNRLKVKSYVVVFICFVTKAIHLELVTDLTTETCLAAITRFFSRRGKAKNIYTDNGTNFVGSRNQIMELQALIWSEEFNNTIQHTLSNDNINWHFSPPRSPHFGGLWEAAIEAILNSRPIIPISSDPNDLIALTPGHFLIGDSLTNLPECDLTEVAANRLSLWQHIQQVKQHFWKRWHTDYLHELHTRNKWHRQDSSQMKVGTLVTIQEDNVPPMHWRLGRIVIVHPGDDNILVSYSFIEYLFLSCNPLSVNHYYYFVIITRFISYVTIAYSSGHFYKGLEEASTFLFFMRVRGSNCTPLDHRLRDHH